MKIRIWTALITVYILWGSTYLAIRFAVETMPPFLMAAIRFLIAGSIMYGWRRLVKDGPPTRIQWRSAAIVGLLLLLGGNGGLVWAEQRVASGVAALIIGSAPLWMVTLDAIRPGGTKPKWQTIVGVGIGFVGIVLLVAPWNNSGSHQLDMVGVTALLLSAFLWAVGSLYSRNAHLPESPLLGTGMEMLVGGIGLLIVGTAAGEWARVDVASISQRSIISLLYLIVFGALIGFASYTWLLRNAPTPLVSTYAYVNPIVAIFLGSVLAAEPITPRILISALIVLGSVAVINTARTGAQSAPKGPTVPTLAGND